MKWLVVLPFPFNLVASYEIPGMYLHSIAGAVQIFLQDLKKPIFQWMISSLFQEKNRKYFLSEKQALKE